MSHLSFEERYEIAEGLEAGFSIHKIAKKLGRSDSSIAREIKRNRISVRTDRVIACTKEMSCKVQHGCGDETCKKLCLRCFPFCHSFDCPEYVQVQCKRITGAPFCCNGCKMEEVEKKICRFPKFKYSPKNADYSYMDRLRSSRRGIAMTPEQMRDLDELVSPLLLQGQSIQAIYMEHREEIPCSERTLYNYVDGQYLTARNLDMPRKVRFKTRYKHSEGNKRNKDPFTFGRTYTDFKAYVASLDYEPSIVEMDCVIGSEGGKVLLTLLFRKTKLMIAYLLPRKTQECVINALNSLCEAIGIEMFQKYFEIILTDRGTEFSNPYALECDNNGEIKTKVFYCDPYCSWQKGALERNHEFIRYVLPKGQTFDNLTQEDITLLMIHINNYPRKDLNEKSPYELAALLLDNKVLRVLHYHKIRPDDVILKPWLLKR